MKNVFMFQAKLGLTIPLFLAPKHEVLCCFQCLVGTWYFSCLVHGVWFFVFSVLGTWKLTRGYYFELMGTLKSQAKVNHCSSSGHLFILFYSFTSSPSQFSHGCSFLYGVAGYQPRAEAMTYLKNTRLRICSVTHLVRLWRCTHQWSISSKMYQQFFCRATDSDFATLKANALHPNLKGLELFSMGNLLEYVLAYKKINYLKV